MMISALPYPHTWKLVDPAAAASTSGNVGLGADDLGVISALICGLLQVPISQHHRPPVGLKVTFACVVENRSLPCKSIGFTIHNKLWYPLLNILTRYAGRLQPVRLALVFVTKFSASSPWKVSMLKIGRAFSTWHPCIVWVFSLGWTSRLYFAFYQWWVKCGVKRWRSGSTIGAAIARYSSRMFIFRKVLAVIHLLSVKRRDCLTLEMLLCQSLWKQPCLRGSRHAS